MKFIGTILFVCAGLLNPHGTDDARSVEATNAVVISTAFINGLVAEARTNNPSLKAADYGADHANQCATSASLSSTPASVHCPGAAHRCAWHRRVLRMEEIRRPEVSFSVNVKP